MFGHDPGRIGRLLWAAWEAYAARRGARLAAAVLKSMGPAAPGRSPRPPLRVIDGDARPRSGRQPDRSAA